MILRCLLCSWYVVRARQSDCHTLTGVRVTAHSQCHPSRISHRCRCDDDKCMQQADVRDPVLLRFRCSVHCFSRRGCEPREAELPWLVE